MRDHSIPHGHPGAGILHPSLDGGSAACSTETSGIMTCPVKAAVSEIMAAGLAAADLQPIYFKRFAQ